MAQNIVVEINNASADGLAVSKGEIFHILYVGGFRFPNGNASAVRALESARLMRSCGYTVTLMGKIETNDGKAVASTEIGGFTILNIELPDLDQTFRSYTQHLDSVEFAIRNVLDPSEAAAVVAYNYPATSLRKLIRYCRIRRIPIVAECTEWHGWEGKKILRNCIRWFHTQLRMRILAARANNVIVASRQMREFYKETHCLRLPFVVDPYDPKWARVESAGRREEEDARFVYFGSPGLDCSKDSLHLIIEAFYRLRNHPRPFSLTVIGPNPQDLFDSFGSLGGLVTRLGSKIQFLGQLPHTATLDEVKRSDFMVLLRPNNRTSNAGFPTKIVEAISCGTPVISNRTSDIAEYVVDGKTGILANEESCTAFVEALESALALSGKDIESMSLCCRENNPFDASLAKVEFCEFFSKLRFAKSW